VISKRTCMRIERSGSDRISASSAIFVPFRPSSLW
jgi:hypothetical protein